MGVVDSLLPQERQNSMGRSYWLHGARFAVHGHPEDTAGRYDLIEGGGPPGFQTPLHRHTRYAEQFYVLAGKFTVWAGERTAVLRPGDAFTVPAGTAHAVAAPPDELPDNALFDRICAEIGDENLGPPGAGPGP
jgi:quercetin dioxygenase-like cupin family protein